MPLEHNPVLNPLCDPLEVKIYQVFVDGKSQPEWAWTDEAKAQAFAADKPNSFVAVITGEHYREPANGG